MDPITFNTTGAVQSYVVQRDMFYSVTAFGAQGGDYGRAVVPPGENDVGGLGAMVSGTFALQADDRLLFVVGRTGKDGGGERGGDGGGGTFVFVDVDRSGTITSGDHLLLAAGGGGGSAGYGSDDVVDGQGADRGSGDGKGGFAPGFNIENASGGGGAGINGPGETADDPEQYGYSGGGAASILSDGGGGGGAQGGLFDAGGGGGGYSGGSGGRGSSGGGGTSYIDPAAAKQLTAGGVERGDGRVVLTAYVPTVIEVATPASGQTRLTVASAGVGDSSPNEAGGDGGLAVRLQAEDAAGNPTGTVSRYSDEDITFIAADGGSFDVRDSVAGVSRGDGFGIVKLGAQGNDTLNDTLTPSVATRATYFDGGQGNDTITGGRADDLLIGGTGNDILRGNLGNDRYLGGTGNDTAIINLSTDGADLIDLGEGADTVNVSLSASGQVRLTLTSAAVGNGSATDGGTLPGQDGGLAVRLQAEDANGNVIGPVTRSDDEGVTLIAGDGVTFDVRDLVSGVQRGDEFRYVMLGTSRSETLTAVNSGLNDFGNYINAGAGDDKVEGASGNDVLVGGAGNDFLVGGIGRDILIGGDGDDTYSVDTPNDQVFEAVSGGIDRVIVTARSYALAAGQEIEELRFASATRGNYNLTGNEFANSILGNAGNNILDGGGGVDRLSGGGGDDTYIVDATRDLVFESVDGGYDRVIATATGYTLAAGQEIEELQFASSTRGNYGLTGNEFANAIVGNVGNNTIDGGGGADRLTGGGGNDTFYVDTARDRVFEAVGGGLDRIIATATSYTLAAGQEIEELRFASTTRGNYNLTGNEFANTIQGNVGNNTLDGGGGADRLTGGAGNDIYYVDTTRDLVFESRSGGFDRVMTTTSYTLAAGQEIEELRFATSTHGNFSLTGNEFANSIQGNAGNNKLDGGGGVDRLTGGGGDDTYTVDTARDLVFESRGGGFDRVIATATSYTLAASQEIEALQFASTTRGNYSLTGNEFANIIRGNVGDNVLNGRGGADELTGGGGADTFMFDTRPGSGNVDRITDFREGNDTIQLSRSVFTELAAGKLSASAFKDIGVAGATYDADDRVLYDSRDGTLSYDSNGSATGGRVVVAVLTNQAQIDHTDFFVV